MRNRILKYLSVICVIVIIASPALSVSAEQTTANTFVVSCGTPSTGSGTGYLEVYMKKGSDVAVRVFMWSIYSSSYVLNEYVYDTIVDNCITVTLDNSGSVSYMRFSLSSEEVNKYNLNCSVYSLSNTGSYFGSEFGYSSSKLRWTFDTSYEVVSYRIYGNYNLDKVGTYSMEEFYVLYSESGAIFNAINNGQQEQTNQIIQGQQAQTDAITSNQNANTDKLLDAGSDTAQPDFNSANSAVDNTTNQMQSIEGSYKIDAAATQTALNSGNSFLNGTDMQRASIQVKQWIEKFTSDNPVVMGFLISAMVLGLCFWVIGRKSWGG